jgi:GntR family transcriptional repressor for pyruvate dehydrogenase complex
MSVETPLVDASEPRPVPRNRKTSESLARQLVADIVSRRLPPDAPLPPETVMLRQYGVSRASLREALRILEVHGLITIKSGPRGGPRITRVDASDFGKMATFYYQATHSTFTDLAEARLCIEPITARLAAERASDEQLDALQANLDTMSQLGPNDDERLYVDLSLQFHSAIGHMAGNKVLELIGSSFQEIFTVYAAEVLTPEENRKVVRIHQRIADALKSRDGGLAERLMQEHLDASNKDLGRRHPALLGNVVGWL